MLIVGAGWRLPPGPTVTSCHDICHRSPAVARHPRFPVTSVYTMTPERFQRLKETLDRRQPDLTVALENVHKPHNFSAILRTCDAVGIFAAHAVTPRGPIRESRPTSGGSHRWVQTATYGTTTEVLDHLRQRGFRILAADLRPGAIDYRQEDYTAPTALLMGQEKFGVSDEAAAGADGFVTIPMLGLVASLNVSVAAALILFEAQHQRSSAGLYDRRRLDAETWNRTLFEWSYPELAAYCQAEGLLYPRLGAEGELLDPIP